MLDQEYIVNEYITVKLENGNINIYVENKFFRKCNFLSVNFPNKHLDVSNILSQPVEKSNQSKIECKINFPLSQEVEFREYCNRFHAWMDHKYDSRILPLHFALPLMKKLMELKDPRARKLFKEEVAKRIASGAIYEIYFLIFNNYFPYLNAEETELCYDEYIERNGIPEDLLLLYEFGRGGVANAYERLEKVLCLNLQEKFPFFNEKFIPDKNVQVELIRQIIYDLFLYQSVKFSRELFKGDKKLIKNTR